MTEKKRSTKGKRSTPSPDQQTEEPTGLLIGLDIGYGFTKIIRADGRQTMFPSAVAAIAPTVMSHLGGVSARDEVVVERVRCIVGERAIGKDDRFTNLHNVWWTSTAYKALIAYAKQWIPARSSIVTGLPLHSYIAPDARQLVKDIVKTGLQARDVLVIPQGVGAFFSDPSFEHPTQKVAIVDIGTWTTELIGMAGQDLVSDASAGHVLGVSDIFSTVAGELKDRLGRVVDPYEVERAHRGEGEIRYQGRAFPKEHLIDRVGQLAKERAGQILAKMTDLWGPHAASFESILFCGGGATLLYPYLKSFREGSILVKEAQFANASGYLQVASNVFGTPAAAGLPRDVQAEAALPITPAPPAL